MLKFKAKKIPDFKKIKSRYNFGCYTCKLVLETDYNHSLFRLLKDLRRWLFCQTGFPFHSSSSVSGSGQN